MRKWNTPEVNELRFAMTADGLYNNTVEGISVPCYDVITGEFIEGCENITNKKCAEKDS